MEKSLKMFNVNTQIFTYKIINALKKHKWLWNDARRMKIYGVKDFQKDHSKGPVATQERKD